MAADDLPPLSSDPDVLCTHVRELRWRMRALDRWREDVEGRVTVLESEVVTEKEARMLRDALHTALEGKTTTRWTRLQQLAALAVVAVAIADFVRSFTG